MSQHYIETFSLQTIYQPVPVEGAFHHDLQIGLVGLKQLADSRHLVTQLLLHHYFQLLVDYTHVTISCTQIDSAVELHQRWPPFLVERLVKQTQLTSFAFGRLY